MLLFQFDVAVAAELGYLNPSIYFVYFTNHYDLLLQTISIGNRMNLLVHFVIYGHE